MELDFQNRNIIVNNLHSFFNTDSSDQNETVLLVPFMMEKAFEHYRGNGKNETFEYYSIGYYIKRLNFFELELQQVIATNIPFAVSVYFNELIYYTNWIKSFNGFNLDSPGIESLKLPLFRTEQVSEDIPPGLERDYTMQYAYNLLAFQGKRLVEKQVPIQPESSEQFESYINLYNELIFDLRNQFLLVVDKHIANYTNGIYPLSLKEQHVKLGIPKKTSKYGNKTLLDIWLPDKWNQNKEQYYRTIEILKERNESTQSSFIREENGNLYWQKLPPLGFAQYIAGLVNTLMTNKWIDKGYSAPELKDIISNTFNIEFDPEPLKSVHVPGKVNNKYILPFKTIPLNI